VLRQARPELPFDFVEIDPVVPQVAERFLGFSLRDGDRLHIDDARRFLAATDRRWDFILADTYIGPSVPFHLATAEYFALLKAHLAPGGVLAVNLAGGLDHPFSRAIFRTLAESLPTIYAFKASGRSNVVVFATADNRRRLREDLIARARRLDAAWTLPQPLTHIASDSWVEIDLDLLAAPLLTDRLAPVERLVSMAPGRSPEFAEP
jgi:spermidine synthase